MADTRLHGTIRQQVGPYFTQAERPALRPLPASLFPSFEEAPRKVHRDGHIAFQHTYYSVPPEYLGHEVWVRAESRLLHIFTRRMELIATHVRAEPGRFVTNDAHLHSHKRHLIERGADHLRERCQLLGPNIAAPRACASCRACCNSPASTPSPGWSTPAGRPCIAAPGACASCGNSPATTSRSSKSISCKSTP